MVKLTKAQKKALKIKKAEEKLKALEEALLQKKKNDIKREVDMQNLSISKMERSWRHFMIQLKLPFFREEVKSVWSVFERVMDKKDGLVKELQHQMRAADNQQRLSLAALSDAVDIQLKRFHVCLKDMDKSFDRDLKALKQRSDCTRDAVATMKHRTEWGMAVLRWAGASQAQEAWDRFQGESVVKYYEMDLMFDNDRKEMENMLERRFTLISDVYKEVLKEYFSKTAENRKKLEKLKSKDTMMSNIIIKQERRMEDNFFTLKRLRQKVQLYEDGTVMAGIRTNYKRIRDEYNTAKNTMDGALQLDLNQFTDLVDISNITLKWADGVVKRGEQILTMYALCQKLQTALEISGSTKDNHPLLLFSKDTETPRMNETLENYEDLKCFWALVAEAEISRKSLQDERNQLIKENEELQDYFKTWMEVHKFGDARCPSSSSGGTPSVVEAAHEFKKIKCGSMNYII